MTSREALQLRAIPERLLVIGGGYIGLELGSIYARLGSQVIVVELAAQLPPGIERERVQVLQQTLRKRGVEIHLRTKVTGLQHQGQHVTVSLAQESGSTAALETDHVLVAGWRPPKTTGSRLDP